MGKPARKEVFKQLLSKVSHLKSKQILEKRYVNKQCECIPRSLLRGGFNHIFKEKTGQNDGDNGLILMTDED